MKHKVEASVQVYLFWDGTKWVVDSVTCDGHPLDPPSWYYTDQAIQEMASGCECDGDGTECLAAAEEVHDNGFPTAQEVAEMILAGGARFEEMED